MICKNMQNGTKWIFEKCLNCGIRFEAGHLSRKYCCERCKRQAFRKLKQVERNKEKLDRDQYLKSNAIVVKLYKADGPPLEFEELLKAGYDKSYSKDKIRYYDKMLVIYEDHYLEIQEDKRVKIHKKLWIMYYDKSEAFDITPVINAKNNNSISQQPVEHENSGTEINGWVVLATILLSAGAVYLFVSYIDSPLETSRRQL
jgi:hypothetical protein